jgi:uncharacterized damage-inducible protein DinB
MMGLMQALQGAAIHIYSVSMSLGKCTLLNELRYTAWANQLMLDACSGLTVEELGRNLGVSHQDIINTMQHMYDGEANWSERLYEDTLPALDGIGDTRVPAKVTPEQMLKELKEKWPRVWNKLENWLEGLTEEELEHEMLSQMVSGSIFRLRRWELLRHVMNHATLHRGQVIGMLRGLGKQPPSTDLMTYFLKR